LEKKAERSIRILMVVENCPYSRDPRVRKEAAALVASGHKVAIICPADTNNRRFDLKGVTLHEFPIWKSTRTVIGYLVEYVYAMLAISVLTFSVWVRAGFDVIHIANPPDCVVLLLAAYKLIGKTLIYDQHDISPELYAAKFGRNKWFSRLLLELERHSYRSADHVIVTNESYKEHAMRRGALSESKITVVRNGPDLADLRISEGDIELRRKSPNIIAFAGVTGIQDGLDGLCSALHHLRYRLGVTEFLCIVLGDGDGLASAKSLARELQIEGNMWFAGWVADPKEYAAYIATADICVAPDPFNSYNDRSTFLKIMEYMAARKPIVGFDLRETRVSAQDAALYARAGDNEDFAQKIAALIANPELRHRMGIRGAARVQEKLAWQYSIPGLMRVYGELTGASFAVVGRPVSPAP